MAIDAKIICDSINPAGNRITSWVVKFPRFILAEFNTHRMLSRNSSSSRAIPIERIIKDIQDNPALPEFWGKNQKGMQAAEEITDPILRAAAQTWWLEARDKAIFFAKKLQGLDVHKQIANRLLEPWMHQTVLCTATEWENFFALRAHKDAQPEFKVLAHKMLEIYNAATPKELGVGEWHIPFGDQYLEDISIENALKICTARAARVSYNNFEGNIDFDKDYALHDNLLASGHLSPFEHCAQSLNYPMKVGNFVGWTQYRKMFKGENKNDPRIKKG